MTYRTSTILSTIYSKPLDCLRTVGLLFIVTLSVLVNHFYEPYRIEGPQLLDENGFSGGNPDNLAANSALVEVKDGLVRIENSNGDRSVSISQDFKPPLSIEQLVLSARARTKAVRSGQRPWNCARVTLVSFRANPTGPHYHYPHELFCLEGSDDWQRFSRLFHIYPDVEFLRLNIQLSRASGALFVEDILLQRAVQRTSWTVIQATMIAISVTFIALVFLPYYRQRSGCYEYFALLGVFLIVVLTAIPPELKIEITDAVLNGLVMVPKAMAEDTLTNGSGAGLAELPYFYRVLHFIFFAATILLVLPSLPHRSVANKFYDMLTLALITECIQVYVPGRGPSIIDAGVDMAGVMAGVLIAYVYSYRRSNQRQP